MPRSSEPWVRLRLCLIQFLVAAWMLGPARCLVPRSTLPYRTASSRHQPHDHNMASRFHCRRNRVEPLLPRLMDETARPAQLTMGSTRGREVGKARSKGRGDASAETPFALRNEERLQKFLSHAGVESRRQCEQMILDGRVRVNGKRITELGMKVNPSRDQVHVDGSRVFMRPSSEVHWIVLNKPKGVVCTMSDELGRPTAVASVPRGKEMRLVPVGRLDRDSCGLILLTNENSWINPLTHPSYGHEKTYRVTITSGYPTREEWDTLTRGMLLDGDPNPTRPCIVEVVDYDKRRRVTTIDIIIREGKNRQIRRMFEGVGHEVKSITRVAHGPIRLRNLRPGEWRELAQWEITKLKNLTTKTLKSPSKQPHVVTAPVRDEPNSNNLRSPGRSTNSASSQVRMSSRHSLSSSKVLSQPRDLLDNEEDMWNSSDAFRRGGGRGVSGVSTRRPSFRQAGIVPALMPNEDNYEWVTSSWARAREESERGSRGWQRPKKEKNARGKKEKESEADVILRKVAQGVKMVPPKWEGGGRVEQGPAPRRNRRRRTPWERTGKGSWEKSRSAQ